MKKNLKDTFTFDDENYYEGYHDPSKLWNGFNTPAFEIAAIDELIKFFDEHPENETRLEWVYKGDATLPTLRVWESDFDPYDVEEMPTDTEDGNKILYPLGAYGWVWWAKNRQGVKSD